MRALSNDERAADEKLVELAVERVVQSRGRELQVLERGHSPLGVASHMPALERRTRRSSG